jgi:hypothetical protein
MKPILSTLLKAVALLSTTASFAGESSPLLPPPPAPAAPQLTDDAWKFTVGLPGWLAGLNGDVGVHGFAPIHTEASFSQILDHLDMIGALSLEAQHGPWSFYAEGIYLKLSAGGATPGPLLNTVSADLQQVLAEAEIAYRLWEGKRGYFDLFAGVRYYYLSTTINFDVSESGVRAVSENLASEAVDRITSAVKGAVSEVLPEVKAAVREKIGSAARERIEQRVGQILGSYPRLPEALRLLANSNGPVSDAVKEVIAAQIAEKQANLSDAAATASAEVAAAKARAKSRLSQAVQRAERKLAKRIDTAIRKAIPESVGGAKGWIDPIIGFRARYNLTDQIYLVSKGDIGGFGVGSDLSWQAYGAFGYQLNNQWSTELGYRYLSVDYSQGGFVYDSNMSGLFLGLKYTF